MTIEDKFKSNPMKSRADFQDAVRALFEPLVPYLERQGALMDFQNGAAHFDMQSSSLEGVARPLWGLVPLSMGGGEMSHWPLMRKAIAEGVDPDHPNYWGPTHDRSQRNVEMAALGVMLMLLPEEGWYPFSDKEKTNFLTWLDEIQRVELVDNNWLFFGILVQEGLRKIGKADLIDEALLKRGLDRIEEFYLGDGWYGDGADSPIDHYNGFAIHFYALLYAEYSVDPDIERCKRFRGRAGLFAEQFAHWFAETGETVMVGRSMIYRFATAAFWGLAIKADQQTLSIGAIKGIWARQIRSWRDLPIFTKDGRLTRGYAYPNLIMCEEYNSPTSPYWAMKAFFPLAFPEDSEFWNTPEEPLPVPKDVVPMPAIDSIVQRSGGHSILHYGALARNQFQWDKYNKFAYSTFLGPDMASLLYSNNFSFGDNILAFSDDGGLNWAMCHVRHEVRVEGDRIVSTWMAGKQTVKTTVIPGKDGYFQRHHVFTLRAPTLVVDTGFAVSEWYTAATILTPDGSKTFRSGDVAAEIAEGRGTAGASVTARGENGTSGIRSLDNIPKTAALAGRIHSNLSSPRTLVPFLAMKLDAGTHELQHEFLASPETSSNEPIVS